MFWGNLSNEQIERLINLVNDEEIIPKYMEDNSTLLNNILLTDFQCFSIEHCYITKGSLISLGTGLGKTLTSIGYCVKRLRENQTKKCLFFSLPESKEQVAKDFNKYSDFRVALISGEHEIINALKATPISSWDALVISYEALYSTDFANWFIQNSDMIDTAIFDEVHGIANKSLINSIISIICKDVESKMFLTATPITTDPKQVIRLMLLLDEDMIPEGEDYLKPYEIRDPETFEVIDYHELDSLSLDLFPRYFSKTRKEVGVAGNYHPYLIEIEPTQEQCDCQLKDAFKIIKGDPNSRQAEALYKIVEWETQQSKKGLIYAYNKDISESLCEHLISLGIVAKVLNGDLNNKKERAQNLKDFELGLIDVLITNLTESLNLASDYLIFWQFTNKSVQMLGRCERGFLIKDLDIFLIVTKNTVEVQQYQENVYKRCKWLGEALDKDVDIFERFSKGINKANHFTSS